MATCPQMQISEKFAKKDLPAGLKIKELEEFIKAGKSSSLLGAGAAEVIIASGVLPKLPRDHLRTTVEES